MKKLKILMVASAATMLSSCDLSQIPGLDGKLSIEDSKAVGAACRHSGRALEDCFTMNPNTYQSGVFEGWRDMNDYMIANGLDVVKPEIRNSAFKPEQTSLNSGAHTTPEQSGPNAADDSVETAPLAQGRQRWVPKGQEAPSTVPPQAEVAAGKTEDGSTQPPAVTDEPADAKAPTTPPEPARPWERKKDPKKHT